MLTDRKFSLFVPLMVIATGLFLGHAVPLWAAKPLPNGLSKWTITVDVGYNTITSDPNLKSDSSPCKYATPPPNTYLYTKGDISGCLGDTVIWIVKNKGTEATNDQIVVFTSKIIFKQNADTDVLGPAYSTITATIDKDRISDKYSVVVLDNNKLYPFDPKISVGGVTVNYLELVQKRLENLKKECPTLQYCKLIDELLDQWNKLIRESGNK